MKEYSRDLWARTTRAIQAAGRNYNDDDYDAGASRAYYAAFYAVSALFSLKGSSFNKHSAVETAVHRDLVKPGIWTVEMGADYRSLHALRSTGDYGGLEHVSSDQAEQSLQAAERILSAVKQNYPELIKD